VKYVYFVKFTVFDDFFEKRAQVDSIVVFPEKIDSIESYQSLKSDVKHRFDAARQDKSYKASILLDCLSFLHEVP